MDTLVFKTFGWFGAAVVALFLAMVAADSGFAVHMAIVGLAALLAGIAQMRSADYAVLTGLISSPPAASDTYDDEPVRWGVVATVFWGLIGFLVGLVLLRLVTPLIIYFVRLSLFQFVRCKH